jgi:hypothetical protein
MKEFTYVESSKKNAIGGILLWIAVITPLSIICIIHWESNIITKFASFLVFFCGIISLFALLKIYNANGNWEVLVKSSKVIWKTPDKQELMGEKSFEYKISEINKVTGKEEIDLDKEVNVNYQIFLNNGVSHSLMTYSNIPMDEFIQSLKENGVTYEHQKI